MAVLVLCCDVLDSSLASGRTGGSVEAVRLFYDYLHCSQLTLHIRSSYVHNAYIATIPQVLSKFRAVRCPVFCTSAPELCPHIHVSIKKNVYRRAELGDAPGQPISVFPTSVQSFADVVALTVH